MPIVRTLCRRLLIAGALTGTLWPASALAKLCVNDDAGRQVCLTHPAQRIVSLSPGGTELLYDAGAGGKLLATVDFSDYPAAARKLPRIGSAERLDLEAILAWQPDLVVAWRSGNPKAQVARLEQLGLTVYRSEPRHFADIGSTLERLGKLAGSESVGDAAAAHFRAGIDALRQQYAHATPVTVFYEIWEKPLMTVNGRHLISQAIRLCGGSNIFAGLSSLAPRVSREAVIAKNPQAIVVGGLGENNRQWLSPWKAFPALSAVQHGNLFFVPPSTLQRPTPRMLDGVRSLCQDLEQARARR